MHQRRLAADSHRFRRLCHGRLEISDSIDQLHRHRLLPGPNLAIGNRFHIFDLHGAAVRHCLHELSEHVVDERLHVDLLVRC